MFHNYLAAALRNLTRNKVYAALNIVGLAVGFAAALLIALFVRDELSYDRWIPGAARIYMLTSNLAVPNQRSVRTNLIPEELAPPMPLDFSGLDQVVRLQPARLDLRHGDLELADQLVYFADPAFFSVIQLPVRTGDLKTALNEPDAVVVTLAAARKYFGKDTPIGEVMQIIDSDSSVHPVKVTAILKDLPSNTQFNTDVILSARSELSSATRKAKIPGGPRGWGVGSYTYFTLKRGGSVDEIAKGLPDFVARHKPDTIGFVGHSPLSVLRMTDVHLQSGVQGGNFATLNPSGDPEVIKSFSIVGVLLVLIAAINFINLSTARAARRAVEVGMRKVVGAEPLDLVIQFIGESLIYVTFGMVLAMGIVALAMPAFNGYLKRTIRFDFWADPLLLSGIAATILFVGVAAGAYPALVLSRFRPRTVLKSGVAQGRSSSLLRSALVVLQFAILIAFIAMTFMVARQTSYALDRGMKLDTDRVYVMRGGCSDAMQDAVRAVPGVAGIACSANQAVGTGRNATTIRLQDGTSLTIDIAPMGYGFFELYGIQPLKGRVFQRDRPDQPPESPLPTPGQTPPPPPPFTSPLIVNATLARKIDASSTTAAVGERVSLQRGAPNSATAQSEIIAVVPDFAVDVAHQVVPPTAYFMLEPRQITRLGLLSLRLRADADEKATLGAVDKIWKRVGPARPVSRYAMKDRLTELNADMIRQSQIFIAFSVIAVFIAALGLFGLSAFTAERRTKEIGVRKALGADRVPIMQLLIWQFTKPVLWANLIAWPVGYYAIDRWLSGFAYHTTIEPWLFLAASCIALVIAWVTISGYSYKVSGAKAATALRYE